MLTTQVVTDTLPEGGPTTYNLVIVQEYDELEGKRIDGNCEQQVIILPFRDRAAADRFATWLRAAVRDSTYEVIDE